MSAAPAADPVLRPFPGVVVHPRRSIVELEARVAINEGWLEQVACAPGTREHESLVVPRATPSQIHAALLMAGFIPGSPGRWEERDGELRCTPPTGSALDVRVRYADAAGETVEEPIRRWIVDHNGHEPFPDDPWIFAGSIVEPNPEWMGPGTHYVADLTGSIIGLVTFGDETIGFSRVLADQISVQPAEWEAATDRMPVPGTEVTIVLKKRE